MPKVARTGGLKASRNQQLIPGVNRWGRSQMSKKRGAHKFSKKGYQPVEKKEEKKAPKAQPRFYAADDIAKPIPSRKANRKPTKLRSSITPGTVLIVLAGRFKGKRVVFLKQLESGLLLITGPFQFNGVPLRRINQAYVIATTTKVDVAGADASKISDALFAKEKSAAKKVGEKFLTEAKEKKSEVSAERKNAQKAIDTPIVAAAKKVSLLAEFLAAPFTLTKNQAPHLLKF
jgi:large subunit ribosomal protein L6e